MNGGNAWQTDRTFIEHGERPILENKLHILDYGGDGQYTLVYQPYDQVGPSVTSVTGSCARHHSGRQQPDCKILRDHRPSDAEHGRSRSGRATAVQRT